MTLVGKIFTMLIFIMSLCFMMIAVSVYATHRDWRAIVTARSADDKNDGGLKAIVESQLKTNRELAQQRDLLITEVAREKAARAAALAALESKLSLVTAELADKETKLAEIVKDHGEATQTVKTQQELLLKLTDEVKELRTEIVASHQEVDDYRNRVVKVTDDIHQARGILERLKETEKVLTQDLTQYKAAMDVLGTTKEKVLARGTPPLDALVLAVNDTGLVEVSLGEDSGLKVGHVLVVYRNQTYLGKIRIRKATADRAVGELIPGTPQGEIRKGDRVSTKVT